MKMREERFLNLAPVFSYLQANAENRCFGEGEWLLNVKHVILSARTAETKGIYSNICTV